MKKPVVARLARRLAPRWDVLPLDLPLGLLLGLLLPVLDLLLDLHIHLTARVPAMAVIQDTTVRLQQANTVPVPALVPRPVLLQAQAMASRRIPVALLDPSQATHLHRTGTQLLLPILDTVLHNLHTELPLLSLGTDDLLQGLLDIPRDHHMDRDRLLRRDIE